MPFSRNVTTAATSPPTARVRGHFARASSRRSGDPRDVLHAQETPRARSGGHRVRRRTAARGASSASAWMHSTARLFPLLHRAPPRGVPTSPTRLSISARFPRALTRIFPPLHHTTHAQRGRGAGVRRAPRVPRQPRGGRGGGCRAGNGRRRGDPGGGRDGRGGAEPPVKVTLETVAGLKNAARHAGESRSRRAPDARDERRLAPLATRVDVFRRETSHECFSDSVYDVSRRRHTRNRGVAAPLTATVRRGVRVVPAPVAKSDRHQARRREHWNTFRGRETGRRRRRRRGIRGPDWRTASRREKRRERRTVIASRRRRGVPPVRLSWIRLRQRTRHANRPYRTVFIRVG